MLTESIRRMSCSHSRCFLQSSVSQVTSSNSITPWTTLLVRSVRPRLLRSWSAADKQPRLEPGWVLTTKFVLSCSSGYKSPASYNADGLKQRLTESWSGLWQNDMTLLLASKQKSVRELGDISNIYCRTAQSGLRKVSLFSRQNVFIYVCLTAWVDNEWRENVSNLHFVIHPSSLEAHVKWDGKRNHPFKSTYFRNLSARIY